MIARAHLIDLLFVIAPHSLLLDIAGPAEAFRLANLHRHARGSRRAFGSASRARWRRYRPRSGSRLADLEPLPERLSRRPGWCWSASRAPSSAGHAGDRRHGAVAQASARRIAARRGPAAPPARDLLGRAARGAGRPARRSPLHHAPRTAAAAPRPGASRRR